MIVNMGTKTYEMSHKQAKAILGTAKKLANCNIYGIEKGNVLIMLNEKYEDDMSLKKAVEEYKKKGLRGSIGNEENTFKNHNQNQKRRLHKDLCQWKMAKGSV